jgi:hypothetical protein
MTPQMLFEVLVLVLPLTFATTSLSSTCGAYNTLTALFTDVRIQRFSRRKAGVCVKISKQLFITTAINARLFCAFLFNLTSISFFSLKSSSSRTFTSALSPSLTTFVAKKRFIPFPLF